MNHRVHVLTAALVLVLSACAVADVPVVTDSPPLTLAAPPTPIFSGTCANTPDLEQWAQSAYFNTTEFKALMNDAGSKPRSQIFDQVTRMAAIRSEMAAKPTPDCAEEAQQALIAVMNEATFTLQQYANDDLSNLGSAISDYNARLDQAQAIQNELVLRLDNAIRSGG